MGVYQVIELTNQRLTLGVVTRKQMISDKKKLHNGDLRQRQTAVTTDSEEAFRVRGILQLPANCSCHRYIVSQNAYVCMCVSECVVCEANVNQHTF